MRRSRLAGLGDGLAAQLLQLRTALPLQLQRQSPGPVGVAPASQLQQPQSRQNRQQSRLLCKRHPARLLPPSGVQSG